MKILAVEPYFTGSHRAFLRGWQKHSRHEFLFLTLPGHKWKWRMRHAAVTFARELEENIKYAAADVIFCSDMLNLAEFRGLAPRWVRDLPCVCYFHENQLTYPVQHSEERDLHYAFINAVSALAADQVWFNSDYHLRSFTEALADLLERMPDYRLPGTVDLIREKAHIQPPGIEEFPPRPQRPPGPLRLLWAARWEYDKNPEKFFRALYELQEQGLPFELSVLGESFREVPPVFAEAKIKLEPHVRHWGYLENRKDYRAELARADVFVSTADHEFFGIAALEAAAAGALPLLPARLAYPEVFNINDPLCAELFFYDDEGTRNLAERLCEYARDFANDNIEKYEMTKALAVAACYHWTRRARAMDDTLPNPRTPTS